MRRMHGNKLHGGMKRVISNMMVLVLLTGCFGNGIKSQEQPISSMMSDTDQTPSSPYNLVESTSTPDGETGIETGTHLSNNSSISQETPTPPLEITQILSEEECLSSIVQITNKAVNNYFVSEDEEKIYYSLSINPDEWWEYSLRTGEKELIDGDPRPTRIPEKTVSPDFQIEKDWFDLSISPSNKKVIFTVPVFDDKATSTPTPDPTEESIGMGEQLMAALLYDVYFAQKNPHKITFLGQIEGLISEVFWTHDEMYAIVTMVGVPSAYGPASVWKIDIKNEQIEILVPRNSETYLYTTFWGLSTDSNWVFYAAQTTDGQAFFRQNIISGKGEQINVSTAAGISFWEINQGKQLLVVGPYHKEDTSESAYILDLNTGSKYLASNQTFKSFRSTIEFVPKLNILVFLAYRNWYLQTINLCVKEDFPNGP